VLFTCDSFPSSSKEDIKSPRVRPLSSGKWTDWHSITSNLDSLQGLSKPGMETLRTVRRVWLGKIKKIYRSLFHLSKSGQHSGLH
jgi:hypothetical protein